MANLIFYFGIQNSFEISMEKERSFGIFCGKLQQFKVCAKNAANLHAANPTFWTLMSYCERMVELCTTKFLYNVVSMLMFYVM